MNAKRIDKLATAVISLLVGVVVLILLSLIGYILVTGLPHISWHFLTSPSQAFLKGGGIGDQLFNSFYLLVLTLVISFPIALGAGIYLFEYAPKNWVTNTIRVAIEVLSSLPSVVVGLFGHYRVGIDIFSECQLFRVVHLVCFSVDCYLTFRGGVDVGVEEYESCKE